jgi:hypothetical protein
MRLAPVSAIEYLHATLPLASNHGLGVAIAELDLTDWPARGVKLAENYRESCGRFAVSHDVRSELAER